MGKRSAKANCQQRDRALAEFDAVLQKLAKAPKRPVAAEPLKDNYRKPIS